MYYNKRMGRVVKNNSSDTYLLYWPDVYVTQRHLSGIHIYTEDNYYFITESNRCQNQTVPNRYKGFQEINVPNLNNDDVVFIKIDSYYDQQTYNYGLPAGYTDVFGEIREDILLTSHNYIFTNVLNNVYNIENKKQLEYEILIDRLFLEYELDITRDSFPYLVDVKWFENGSQHVRKKIILYSREQVKLNLYLAYYNLIKTARYNIYKIQSNESHIFDGVNIHNKDLYDGELHNIFCPSYIQNNKYTQQIFDFVLNNLDIPILDNNKQYFKYNDIFMYDDAFFDEKAVKGSKLTKISNILDENLGFNNIFIDLNNNIVSALDSSGFVTYTNNNINILDLETNIIDSTITLFQCNVYSYDNNDAQKFVNYIFSFRLDDSDNVIIDTIYDTPLLLSNVIYHRFSTDMNMLMMLCESKLFNGLRLLLMLKLNNNKNRISNVYQNTVSMNAKLFELSQNIENNNIRFNQSTQIEQTYPPGVYLPFYNEYYIYQNNKSCNYNLYNYSFENIYYNIDENNKEILLELKNPFNSWQYEKVINLTNNNMNDYMCLDFGKIQIEKKYIEYDNTIYELNVDDFCFNSDFCISELNVKFMDGTSQLIDYYDYNIFNTLNIISDYTNVMDIINYFYNDKMIFILKIKNNNIQLPKYLIIYNNKYTEDRFVYLLKEYDIYRILELSSKDTMYIKLGN